MTGLADRLRANYPGLALDVGKPDPFGHDIIVNAKSAWNE